MTRALVPILLFASFMICTMILPACAAPSPTPTLAIATASNISTPSLPGPTPSKGAASPNALTQKAGNLAVTLSFTPYPAVTFQETTFQITIMDDKGTPVSDANVSLDLSMPSMRMPANKPSAKSLGDGKYQAAGRFTMRGGWQIAVIVDRGGERQTAYFQLGL
jgi:hypothetical protein